MKRKTSRALGLLLLLLLIGGTVLATDSSPGQYPVAVMRPDPETMARWQAESLAAPKARIDPEIGRMLEEAAARGIPTSIDLLSHIDYDPVERNQGWCGNCWVWAGTGVAEIAHDVQDGVFDRLSIQYLNSCKPQWACCGGWLSTFASWYNSQGLMVPWSNTNASYADGERTCGDGASLVTCGDISTSPNYGLSYMTPQTIQTHTGQENAIANIKNVLNQERGVSWAFYLPNSAGWDNFIAYWLTEGEEDIWYDVDAFCGIPYDDIEGGGHMVVIVGYNDDDPDPANHYWLVLNSWGTADGGRPAGLFRIPILMDYDCVVPPYYAFYFETLDVDFTSSIPIFARPRIVATYAPMGYRALAMVKVKDEAGSLLEGAEVFVTLKDPDGTLIPASGFTNSFGKVRFRMSHPTGGPWGVCIDDVVLAGYEYDNSRPICTAVWFGDDPEPMPVP